MITLPKARGTAPRLVLGLILSVVLRVPALALDPNEPGKFEIYVMVSDSQEYIETLAHSAARTRMSIRPMKRLKVGGTAYVGFIYTGYVLDENKQANLEVDVSVLAPDGSVLLQQDSFAEYKHAPSSVRGFVTGHQSFDLQVEPTDPVGAYKIKVLGHDNVVKITSAAEWVIRVRK